jgi:mRNA interferase HigB
MRTKLADWSDFNDLRQDFPSCDFVGNDRFVFNVKGNRYRLIAIIHFDIRTIYIRFIGTHAEYDKITGIENI